MLHVMTRIMIKLSATILCLSLSGCFGFITTSEPGDIVAYTDATMMKKVDAYAATVSAQPKNNAVAFTKGDKPFPDTRWTWASGQGAATVDAARADALRACENEARSSGVAGPCRVYMVNGVVER